MLDLSFFGRRKAEERGPATAAIEAIEVAGVFDAGDAEFDDDSLVCAGDALLFVGRERRIALLHRKVNLMAGLRRAGCEGEDTADGSELQRFEKHTARAAEDLEADFPGASFRRSLRRSGGDGCTSGEIAGRFVTEKVLKRLSVVNGKPNGGEEPARKTERMTFDFFFCLLSSCSLT